MINSTAALVQSKDIRYAKQKAKETLKALKTACDLQ